ISSTFSSSSLGISTPSAAVGLIPLYSGGLCDAVIMTPPLYPRRFAAYCRHGVGIRPAFAVSSPAELRVDLTSLDRTGCDLRPSYPTTIGPLPKFVPNSRDLTLLACMLILLFFTAVKL